MQHALNQAKKPVNGAKLLVSGIAYKKNISDHRESPAFDVIVGLERLGAVVAYHDRFVPEVEEHGLKMKSVSGELRYGDYDAVDRRDRLHGGVDYARLLADSQLVISDTRDALREVPGDKSKVFGL